MTRFAVAEPDAAWVLRLLAGAALAGAEPCQYQPDTDAAVLAREAAALGHDVIVTPARRLGGRPARGDPPRGAAGRRTRTSDRVSDRPTAAQPLMIRTTGTTGAPKAARHDWRVLTQTVAKVQPAPDAALAARLRPAPVRRDPGAAARRGQPGDARGALSTPAQGRARRPRSPTASPASARRRPSGASCSPRPAAVEVRLPSLEQVTLGGEASPADLLDELRTTFPVARVSQVYASTEFGSITSVTRRPARDRHRVALELANPTSNVRAENGELWVRAEAGMLGYAERGRTAPPPARRVAADRRPRRDRRRPRPVPRPAVGDDQRRRGQGPPLAGRGTDPRAGRRGGGTGLRAPSKLTGSIVAVDIVPVGGWRRRTPTRSGEP